MSQWNANGPSELPVAAPSVRALWATTNAFFAYSGNYLIDTDHGIIMDVEAARSVRQAEAGSARRMIDRPEARFVMGQALAVDGAYTVQ